MKYIFLSTILLTTPLLAFAQDTNFVPLTNLPGISGISGSPDITTLLNNIYRLCIGAAAVIAVFQIMRAGIMFMFNKGSISENEEAKQLISMSILGLILVLSPVIVFGIINPKILELNFGVENLKTDFRGGVSGTPATPGSPGSESDGPDAPPPIVPATGEVNTACRAYRNGQEIPASDRTGEQCCMAQSSANAQCTVNWNYRNEPYVKYCACSFRGTIASSIEYTYYQTYQRVCVEGLGCGVSPTGDPVRVIPRDSARVASYRDTCRAAGGEPDGEDTSWWYENCPDDSGLPTPAEGVSYKCKTATYTCN